MPVDYRRFTGPEDSVSYKGFIKEHRKSYDDNYKELLDKNQLRKDGRRTDEARTMCRLYARTDMTSQAKGSAYVELKKTKVVCSVFDPREIPHQTEFSQLGQIFCEVKFAPFSCSQRRQFIPDAEEKALSVQLKKTLEPAICRHMFPNYQLDVYVYILENDGACLAAAVNAAGLALADAAVPMYDIMTACSLAIIGDSTFVDPTEAEESLAVTSPPMETTNHGVITVVTLHELKQVANIIQVGSIDSERVIEAIDVLQRECAKIVPIIQKVLVKNVVKGFEQRKHLEEKTKKRQQMLQAKMEEWKSLLNGG